MGNRKTVKFLEESVVGQREFKMHEYCWLDNSKLVDGRKEIKRKSKAEILNSNWTSLFLCLSLKEFLDVFFNPPPHGFLK